MAQIVRWLEVVHAGNIPLHLRLPAVLTPLREILNVVLDGRADRHTWSRLIVVMNELELLLNDNRLAGDHEAVITVSEETTSGAAADHGTMPSPPQWYQDVETLRDVLARVDDLPLHVLPIVQEAVMNLLRAVTRRIPTEDRGQPGIDGGSATPWWTYDRHHGLGNAPRAEQEAPSPRGRGTRRPRSASSRESEAESHRRRRLLALHQGDHDL